MDWGIKESWRKYAGKPILSGGVSVNPDGTFHFPLREVTYDPTTNSTKASFSGMIRYLMYCDASGKPETCVLDSTYLDPEVVISKEQQTLTLVMRARARDAGVEKPVTDFGRVDVAQLGVEEAEVKIDNGMTTWSGVATTLLGGDAAEALSYPRNTKLDPIGFSYRGDGGKPDLGERFDPPGVPSYRTALATAFESAKGDSLQSYLSADGSTLFVADTFGGRQGWVTRFQALQPQTLKPYPNGVFTVPDTGNFETTRTVDLAGQRFFVKEGLGDGTVVHSVRWTGSEYHQETVARIMGPFSPDLVWSPATNELVGITLLGEVTIWRPTAKGWVPRSYQVPELDGSYGELLALADGSIVNVREMGSTPAQRIVVPAGADGQVQVRDLPQSTFTEADGPTGYDKAWPTKDGFALVTDRRLQRYRVDANGADPTPTVSLDLKALGLQRLGGLLDLGPTLALLDTRARELVLIRDTEVINRVKVPQTNEVPAGGSKTNISMGPDGSLNVIANVDSGWGLARLEPTGTTASFTEQPQTQQVKLGAGEASREFALAAAAVGDPAPSLQWQVRQPGGRFVDVKGATTARLRVGASFNTDGFEYRVLASNTAGRVVSDVARIGVVGAAVVEIPPGDVEVNSRQTARFSIRAEGTGPLSFGWEMRRPGGEWSAVKPGNGFSFDGSQLVIVNPAVGLNGAEFRAVVSNEFGVVRSSAGRLRVSDVGRSSRQVFQGVILEWAGSEEWQAKPPDGSAANYFSVGVSDGSQRTYSAQRDGFTVVQRKRNGKEAVATWGSRGAHTSDGAQLIRLSNGRAVVEPDGSAVINWPGSFSVNFYDGLVPFAVTNPRLQVKADGTGVLIGDLSGYFGEISNPNKPKEPAPSKKNVVMARFSGVSVDTKNGFVVAPKYAGVKIGVPAGQTPQQMSGENWGAWPQEFVDFHFGTGLAGYFYSTGGALDSKKLPAGFAVGFDQASIPAPPRGSNGGGSRPPSQVTPIPPTINTPGGGGSGGSGGSGGRSRISGELAWGVKASFRSYISGPIAKGRIETQGAAFAGGAFRFGQTETDWTKQSSTSTTKYRGGVRFYGHAGILNVSLADPQIRIDSASRGRLSMQVNAAHLGSQRVDIATLNLGAAARRNVTGGVSYTGVPVTLTPAGSRVFSYQSSVFYQPGTAMDPLSFTVGQAATGRAPNQTVTNPSQTGAASWTPPTTPPARTGVQVDPEALRSLQPGKPLTAWADGFKPGETGIKVVIYSQPVVLQQNLTADANGRVTWTGLLPTNLSPGKHTLAFIGSVNRGIELDIKPPAKPEGCPVIGGELTWGFKETFRAYISGSIANGEWKTSQGATYSTPNFQWSKPTGTFNGNNWTGELAFPGQILFTGHNGLLKTTVANPRIRFVDNKTAYLILDVAGLTMEDALAGKTDPVVAKAATFATLDLTGGAIELSPDKKTITANNIPTAITDEGYVTFPNYPVGTAFDPISFTLTFDETNCATQTPVIEPAKPVPPQQPVPPTQPVPAPAGPAVLWSYWPWLLAAAIGLLIAGAGTGTAATLIATRKSATTTSAPPQP